MRGRLLLCAGVLPSLVCAAGCSTRPGAADSAPASPSADAAPHTGWRAVTSGDGLPPATWTTLDEKYAPDGGPLIALASTNHDSADEFNLYLNSGVRFRDGAFTIHFRADGGRVDAGGGPVWRVRDESNYYLCRANPLESNFRLYVVEGGRRRQLASVEAKHSTGMWHTIEVVHEGDAIRCTLDARARVEAVDATLPAEGGVGLWTKADARTSFVVPSAWEAAGR